MIYQLISPAAQREFIGLDELFYILAILTQFGYFWPVLITKYRLLSIIAVPMLVPIWNILKMIVESFFLSNHSNDAMVDCKKDPIVQL